MLPYQLFGMTRFRVLVSSNALWRQANAPPITRYSVLKLSFYRLHPLAPTKGWQVIRHLTLVSDYCDSVRDVCILASYWLVGGPRRNVFNQLATIKNIRLKLII